MLGHARIFDPIRLAAILVATGAVLLISLPQPSFALSGRLDVNFASKGSVALKGYDTNMPRRDQIAVAADGSFAVVGSAARPARKSADGTETFYGARWSVSLYSKNGMLDSRFGKGGKVVLRFPGERADYPRSSIATSVRFDRKGRLLVAGVVDHATFADFAEAESGSSMQLGFADVQDGHLGLVRLTRRGKLDHNFGTRGATQVHLFGGKGIYGPANVRAVGIGELPSGRIVVGGINTRQSDYLSTGVYAFTPDGKRVANFGTGGNRLVSDATTLRVGSGGSIFLGGIKFRGPNGADLSQSWSVTKLTANGDHDRRYGRNGVAEIKTAVNTGKHDHKVPLVYPDSIDIAPIGSDRVLITSAVPHGTASYTVLTVARLGARGALDKTFGTSGFARAPLGSDSSSSGSSVVMNRVGEIFAGGTINTVPFNEPWQLGSFPFAQGVVVKFDRRGKPDKKWANGGAQQMTPAGVKSCPYGPQLSIQAERVLASGCWRAATWGQPPEIFRLKP